MRNENPSSPDDSLFLDADDDQLRPEDLDAIDDSLDRARGVAPVEDEPDDPETQDDAIDPAAAEASIAFVEQRGGGDGVVPPAEDEPAGPLVWLVPWVISLLAHAGLVVVAVFVVWSVRQVLEEDEVVIPLVTLSETPGGPPLEVEVQQRVETIEQTPAPETPPLPEPPLPEADLLLDLELPGVGEPAAAAPSFEPTLADAAEFDTNFFGSGGNAEDIVFVLEADGSILSDYPQIVGELSVTLRDLSEKQKFAVIVFDGEAVKPVPPGRLTRATADAKARAVAWLRPDAGNVRTAGSGDPVAALELAFRLRPQLVFLLSQNLYNPGRGEYELQRSDILAAFDAAQRRNIAVNTIEFNDLDQLAFDPAGNKVRPTLMEEIAELTGGNYLAVTTNAPDTLD
ncbi:MAG: vWA domain-containing protein [Planctomycetota bacterium]